MAPEVKAMIGHGKPVDLWGLGILTYEMLCGDCTQVVLALKTIVHAGTSPIIHLDWTHSDNLFDFPQHVPLSESAMDFVQKLVIRKSADRLVFDSNDDRDIAKHLWLCACPVPHIPPPVKIPSVANTVPYHDFHKFLISRDRV